MKNIKRTLVMLVAAFVMVTANGDLKLDAREGRSRDNDGSDRDRGREGRRRLETSRDRGSVKHDRDRDRANKPERRSEGRRESDRPRIGHDRQRDHDRDTVRRRDNDRNHGGRDHRPEYRNERTHRHDDRLHSRRIYRRPLPGIMRMPQHRHYGYRHHRYPRHYPRPNIIIIARIPVIVFGHPVYRDCRYVLRTVVNLSGHRAQVLINGHPYFLESGRDYLYPGESASIRVPEGRLYDLDASVLVDDEWYETELEEGSPFEYVIPPMD